MRITAPILVFLICGFGLHAQEARPVKGRVYLSGYPVEAVNVVNLERNKETTTDSTGYFAICGSQGDSLAFSHTGAVTLHIALDENRMNGGDLHIELLPILNQLGEAHVYSNKNISAVAFGIIPKEIEPLTINEKNLKTAGDFKAIQLLGLLGGGVPINPIINKISGRTKRLKKIVVQERISQNYERLHERFSDFIMENIDIEEEELGRFLYFLADNEATSALLEQKDDDALQLLILKSWLTFKNLGTPE